MYMHQWLINCHIISSTLLLTESF
jgi:hypothetical protein